MTTKEAVDRLCKALEEDMDYFRTWQANIAMAFKDEYQSAFMSDGVHDIANRAAVNFLRLLIKQGENV